MAGELERNSLCRPTSHFPPFPLSLLPHQVGITSTLMIHLDVPLQPAAPLLGLAPSTLNPLSTLTFLPAGGDLPLYTMSLPELTTAWCRGWVSNLDYLLALNRASGRCSGDPNNHPVVPWIIDCQAEAPTQGWRDLTYTKYRLNKGDEQLDIAWESVVPHHVSDILSELTYFVYLARRTPLNLLTQYVRSQWVPNEYPSSMARLFAFSPDECIPEFYTDPSIFYSIHPDLPDLEVPIWAASPEEFVRIHRLLLESDEISAMLHHWIDLTFGYKLTGQAAKAAKNVVFAFADGRRTLTNHGVVQLFSRPHPQRIVHGDNDLHDAIESARGQHRKELAMEASSGEVVGKSRPPALASVPPENVVDDVAPSADVNSGVVSTDVAGQTGRESKEAEVGADSGALMRPSTSENSENPAADDVAAAPKPIEEPSTPLPAGPMLYTQSVSTGINSGSMTLISSGALAPVVGPIALPDNLTPVRVRG